MEKTLIGLAAPLEAGSVLSITAFASSAVRGIAELMVPEARVPDGFPPLSPEAEGIIDTATNWAAENLVKGAVQQLTPRPPCIRGTGESGSRLSFRRRSPTTRRSVKRSSPRAGPFRRARAGGALHGRVGCGRARRHGFGDPQPAAHPLRATSCVRPRTRSSLRPFR